MPLNARRKREGMTLNCCEGEGGLCAGACVHIIVGVCACVFAC